MNRFGRGNEGTSQNKIIVFLRNIIELLYRLVAGDKTFYEIEDFEWVKDLEENYPKIREELLQVLNHTQVPSWYEVSKDPNVKVGDSWKTFILCAYGKWVEKNRELCPETSKVIENITCIKTAWFSILEPKSKIPPHSGPYSGVLRYHLGLIIPSIDVNECGIRVGKEIRNWEEGKSLIFDDSHNHEVWNLTNSIRVVLFIDIERPLPFPISLINKFILYSISKNNFIKNLITESTKK